MPQVDRLAFSVIWEMDEEEKAREHYAAVRRIRWVTKKFIPKRVFARFRAPKDK